MMLRRLLTLTACLGVLAACAGAPGSLGVGGYQTFSGTLNSGETFSGVAWHDARTNRNAFCSRLGTMTCSATFPPAGPDGFEPIPFSCSNGLTGTSRSEGKTEFGAFVTTTSWIELSDGRIGAVQYRPVQVWNGEDLCSN